MEHELPLKSSIWMVAASCLSTPIAVLVNNKAYFTSSTGYADGGDMYSHISEALHVKEQLQNWTFDFWFDKVTFGYPMFVAYQPLPTFTTALFMLTWEWVLPPLLAFRLILMSVLTFVPLTWYLSAREFGLSRLQSTYVSLLVFLCHSWHSFGLEIGAFSEYGLYTQAYGMLVFPLAASKIFSTIMWPTTLRQKSCSIILLILTFLSHFFFGMYVTILSGVASVLYLFTSNNPLGNFKSLLSSLGVIYIISLLLMAWWIIPCLISMNYVGGLPWRGQNEDGYPIKELATKFVRGDMFDFDREVPFLTLLVTNGFVFGMYSILLRLKRGASQEKPSMFTHWILLVTVVTFVLFLGRSSFGELYDLIPFHSELEVIRYLSGSHFCGILLASYSLRLVHSIIFYALPATSVFLRKNLSTILVVLIGSSLVGLHFRDVGPRITVTEISQDLSTALRSLQDEKRDGRILAHKGLGTGWPWDLAMIPLLSKKPGLLTYSRGYHDSLSMYYVESIEFDSGDCSSLIQTFQLYNIQYLTIANVEPFDFFNHECQLKEVLSVEGFIVYEVLSENPHYGYFEFIHIAGQITGDLKLMRESVVTSLASYQGSALFLINPSPNLLDVNSSLVHVHTELHDFPSNDLGVFMKPTAVLEWKIEGMKVSFDDALAYVNEYFQNKWIYSQVAEERHLGSKYEAVVEVGALKGGHKLFNQEFLILKVTYHPFWRCYFTAVDDDYTLFAKEGFELFTRLDIHHIAPNFMAVRLPPGRYKIQFIYVIPMIIKILAVISLLCFLLFAWHGMARPSSDLIKSTAQRMAMSAISERGEDPSYYTSWGVQGKFSVLNRLAQENFMLSTDTSIVAPVGSNPTLSGISMSLEEWLDDYQRREDIVSCEANVQPYTVQDDESRQNALNLLGNSPMSGDISSGETADASEDCVMCEDKDLEKRVLSDLRETDISTVGSADGGLFETNKVLGNNDQELAVNTKEEDSLLTFPANENLKYETGRPTLEEILDNIHDSDAEDAAENVARKATEDVAETVADLPFEFPNVPPKRRWTLDGGQDEKSSALVVKVSGKVRAMRKIFSASDVSHNRDRLGSTFVKVPWSEMRGTGLEDKGLFLMENDASSTENESSAVAEDILRLKSDNGSLPLSGVRRSRVGYPSGDVPSQELVMPSESTMLAPEGLESQDVPAAEVSKQESQEATEFFENTPVKRRLTLRERLESLREDHDQDEEEG